MLCKTANIRDLARWFVVLSLGLVTAVVLPACSTVEGAGKDLEKAGEAIQDAAD